MVPAVDIMAAPVAAVQHYYAAEAPALVAETVADATADVVTRLRVDAPRDTPAGATADFLGLRFELSNQTQVLAQIARRAPSAPFAYVVTPNVDHIVRLQYLRSDLWPAYRRAWLTLCDSRILGKLAAHIGLTLPVTPGSDLTTDLFEKAIDADDPVAILGGSAEAVTDLCNRYGLRHVTHYNPPMGFVHNPDEVRHAAEFLVDAHARYSFLAVGSPQQEVVAYQVARLGGATGIGFCIGASLDFLTNRQVRAPRVMQRLAMEWLFRLMANPSRMWRRYLVEGPLILRVYSRWQRHRALRR